MKIGCCDNNFGKFINPLMERWEKDGHEVRFEGGFSQHILEWSDVFFCDTCDNNAKVATTKFGPLCKNKFFVRLLDIEAWVKHHHGVNWNYVNGLIFINDHMKDKVLNEINVGDTKVAVIKCGVDLDKFIFKKKFNGFKIVQVVGKGRIYNDKRVDDAIRILHQARKANDKFTLHVLGTDSGQDYYLKYLYNLVKVTGLGPYVEFVDYVEDLNSWLENKSFMITPGVKEAFSYATAEAMAKGIIPAINHFWGAEKLWPERYIYHDFCEAVEIFTTPLNHNHHHLREYIKKNYNFERFYKEMNKFMGIK